MSLLVRLLAITCAFLAVFAKPHITEAEKNAFVSHVKTNTSGLYFVDLKTDASDEAEDQDTKAKRAVADPALLLLPLFCYAIYAADEETTVKCVVGREPGRPCDEPGAQKFFFDVKRGICQPFYYKGCGGNENRHDSRAECEKTCKGSKLAPAAPVEW
ncbi:unnamed protein product, partial [Mesorhabditis spiculigera]